MHIEGLLNIVPHKGLGNARDYYQQLFEEICSKLLLEFTLCVGKNDEYRVLEVEAYLYDEETHTDPYPHNHPKQRIPGRWYFHRIGMSSGFRGGSRKGMDVTLGDGRMACKGGILIRAIQNKKTGVVIDGPCLLVDTILKHLKVNSITALVDTFFTVSNGNAGDQRSGFWLRHDPPDVDPIIARKRPKTDDRSTYATVVYRSVRIGLGIKGKQDYLHRLGYIGRLYRFVIYPHLLNKGKLWLALELIENSSLSVAEIATTLNTKQSIIEGYQDAFLEGKQYAESTLKQCTRTKDMATGNSAWKCKVLGAIRWWEEQNRKGIHVSL
ncbi:hypothetical protein BGW37DRAFT_473815 [Umbelopsis sp. PMI_123]|nr:hypothetical protein BGW37DRAFT_473815 [Umbelopsis sp. PMI_123]